MTWVPIYTICLKLSLCYSLHSVGRVLQRKGTFTSFCSWLTSVFMFVSHRRRRGWQQRGRHGRRPGIFEWGNSNGSKKRYITQKRPDWLQPMKLMPHNRFPKHRSTWKLALFAPLFTFFICNGHWPVTTVTCSEFPSCWCRGAVWLHALKDFFFILTVHTQKYTHQNKNESAACPQMKPKVLFLKWMSPSFYVSAVLSEVWLYVFPGTSSPLSSFLTTQPAVATENGVRSTSGW